MEEGSGDGAHVFVSDTKLRVDQRIKMVQNENHRLKESLALQMQYLMLLKCSPMTKASHRPWYQAVSYFPQYTASRFCHVGGRKFFKGRAVDKRPRYPILDRKVELSALCFSMIARYHSRYRCTWYSRSKQALASRAPLSPRRLNKALSVSRVMVA